MRLPRRGRLSAKQARELSGKPGNPETQKRDNTAPTRNIRHELVNPGTEGALGMASARLDPACHVGWFGSRLPIRPHELAREGRIWLVLQLGAPVAGQLLANPALAGQLMWPDRQAGPKPADMAGWIQASRGHA